ncbi:hypothetical protein GCM10010178_49690 [Lentzea flava]|uniref:Uncharacterized protein n=1 Tax=Lentzea flava TaxID=103732 RepID=A0ABQ2UW14_9PSEU|nr:hypothetical protein GCM10010178_49690 [Lentzea flava]
MVTVNCDHWDRGHRLASEVHEHLLDVIREEVRSSSASFALLGRGTIDDLGARQEPKYWY